jgi:hypothetical protein
MKPKMLSKREPSRSDNFEAAPAAASQILRRRSDGSWEDPAQEWRRKISRLLFAAMGPRSRCRGAAHLRQAVGFVAILGILALMGMIARNAVILNEQIEAERAEGRGTWDAVVQGTLSRFRPIMLTAISTVLGFIPIAPTVFWGPMAFAIMGGLFVATMLTLIVLPALYVAWFRIKEPAAARPAT